MFRNILAYIEDAQVKEKHEQADASEDSACDISVSGTPVLRQPVPFNVIHFNLTNAPHSGIGVPMALLVKPPFTRGPMLFERVLFDFVDRSTQVVLHDSAGKRHQWIFIKMNVPGYSGAVMRTRLPKTRYELAALVARRYDRFLIEGKGTSGLPAHENVRFEELWIVQLIRVGTTNIYTATVTRKIDNKIVML